VAAGAESTGSGWATRLARSSIPTGGCNVVSCTRPRGGDGAPCFDIAGGKASARGSQLLARLDRQNGVSHQSRCGLHDFALKSMEPSASPQWQDYMNAAGSVVIVTVQPVGGNPAREPEAAVDRSAVGRLVRADHGRQARRNDGRRHLVRGRTRTRSRMREVELDDALGLIDLAAGVLPDGRRGRNTRHMLAGLLRQSAFGRLAGYEDVNDADRPAGAQPGHARHRGPPGPAFWTVSARCTKIGSPLWLPMPSTPEHDPTCDWLSSTQTTVAMARSDQPCGKGRRDWQKNGHA
jgi:hypothetical protein